MRRILIIDDSNTIRKTGERLLTKLGYTVFTAEDGYRAFEVISRDPPELIFLDINMNVLGGFHTCQVIKSNPRFRTIPVVMLTGNDSFLDRVKARHAGAEGFVAKPFTSDDLVGAINRYLPTLAQ